MFTTAIAFFRKPPVTLGGVCGCVPDVQGRFWFPPLSTHEQGWPTFNIEDTTSEPTLSAVNVMAAGRSHNSGKHYFEIKGKSVYTNLTGPEGLGSPGSTNLTSTHQWLYGGLTICSDMTDSGNPPVISLLNYSDEAVSASLTVTSDFSDATAYEEVISSLSTPNIRVGVYTDLDTGVWKFFRMNGTEIVGGTTPELIGKDVLAFCMSPTTNGDIYFVQGLYLLSEEIEIAGGPPLGSTAWEYTAPLFSSAIGGVVTTYGNYKVHILSDGDTFSVLEIGTDPNFRTLHAAGGGGGGGYFGSGGGGGGVIEAYRTIAIGDHAVVVGSGGAPGGEILPGLSGQNTQAFGVTVIGGGHGTVGGANVDAPPASGGSGGGGSSSGFGRDIGAVGTPGQGNAGGNGGPISGYYNSAGGGGAAGPGGHSSTTDRGAGGPGLISDITGVPLMYGAGGGGGGGSPTGGLAGSVSSDSGAGNGGQGNAANGRVLTNAQPGVNGRGGGGGGGGVGVGTFGFAAPGGSGTVIVNYPYKQD